MRALLIVALLCATARADDECASLQGAELAACHEEHDRLATAWRLWRELKDQARADGDTKLSRLATERITAISPRLAHLTLKVSADGAPTGLAIRVDGEPFDLAGLGTSHAIDRGEHRIDAAAPGYAQWTKTLTIENGAFKTVEIGPLEPAGADRPPPDPEAEAVFEEDRPPPPPPPPPAKRKWGGLVTAVVGVVVTGVGLWAGLDAMGKRDDARALGCNDDLSSCPSGAAFDTASAAHGRANLSTALTLGGLVLGAGGLVLWTTGTF